MKRGRPIGGGDVVDVKMDGVELVGGAVVPRMLSMRMGHGSLGGPAVPAARASVWTGRGFDPI